MTSLVSENTQREMHSVDFPQIGTAYRTLLEQAAAARAPEVGSVIKYHYIAECRLFFYCSETAGMSNTA